MGTDQRSVKGNGWGYGSRSAQWTTVGRPTFKLRASKAFISLKYQAVIQDRVDGHAMSAVICPTVCSTECPGVGKPHGRDIVDAVKHTLIFSPYCSSLFGIRRCAEWFSTPITHTDISRQKNEKLRKPEKGNPAHEV